MIESPITGTNETLSIPRLQWFTIVWMAIEVGVAVIAAARAHSVAIAAFGGDSVIELLSAAVVLFRFRSPRWISEQIANRITGWLLVALAAYITADSLYTLTASQSKPEPSYLGIGLLVAAAVVMPWLGRRKRQLAIVTKSSALQADAAQSSMRISSVDRTCRVAAQRDGTLDLGRSGCRAVFASNCDQRSQRSILRTYLLL
jgi:divalent metal cation (Fe/Co/Zn/Cd) transporter